MKIFITIILLIFPMMTFAMPFDDEFSVFDGEFKTFENGKEVKNFSPESLKVHESALAVFNNPGSEEYKKVFLNSFPRSFDLFIKIFHPKNFDQLYDGFIYIHLLHELSKEYPQICGEIILSLTSEACLDADAPNYLRSALKSFIKNHPNIYKKNYEKLRQAQKMNIEKFLSASIHEAGKGTCSYENNESH